MITTLLIANRGEIALRIIRSARARGIRTVAVYSDADRSAPHVLAADVAVRIGPTPATESYLKIDAILDAARRTGADAIHPGYGFLSERSAFARAVVEAGLTFVGPSAEVMESMGRKDLARDLALKAGVPVVPIAVVDASAVEEVEERGRLDTTTYPVLVKAAAGGGGKGMRIVRAPADLDEAIASARREAKSAFGDDTILIERYVEHGRHVEVQVLADSHGNVVHLFERDCSAQRRHQKVLEEAPAPTISAVAREVLLTSAVALSKQVGYENAGTVEFLVSGDEVFFLEMNTRLQVEHPVTEMVVSIGGQPLDLVDLQLRIAAGEPLGFSQADVTCAGHAIEARVYAEDAFNGFLPQAGVASFVHWSSRARIDAALHTGSEVGTSYDPMLGKVIVRGPNREAARAALVAALDDTAILGLTTNLGFLRALVASPAFAENQIDTAWLDSNPDAIVPPEDTLARVCAAWVLAHPNTTTPGPFGVNDGWRLAGPPAPVIVDLDGVVLSVRADSVSTGDQTWAVFEVSEETPIVTLEIDGRITEAAVAVHAHRVEVSYQGHTLSFDRPDAFGPTAGSVNTDGTVAAPMPGTVLSLSAVVGDIVEEGQVCGVMEAMKMELTLKAPFAGVVASVNAAAGDQVALGAPLFTVEPSARLTVERSASDGSTR